MRAIVLLNSLNKIMKRNKIHKRHHMIKDWFIYTDSAPEIFFWKNQFWKKVSRRQQKHEKLLSMITMIKRDADRDAS